MSGQSKAFLLKKTIFAKNQKNGLFMIDTGYYTSEALTLLHSLIGIPSISREEEAAADFLQNYIEETGIMTGRSGNNIWCISPMFDINKPTILLNSHIDTVKPVSGWYR